MSVVVVVTITPIAEHRDEVIAAILGVIEVVHTEPGCEKYALHEGTDRLVLIEKWTDQAALRRHRAQPALAGLQRVLEGRLAAAPHTEELRPSPVGTAQQGVL